MTFPCPELICIVYPKQIIYIYWNLWYGVCKGMVSPEKIECFFFIFSSFFGLWLR